MIRPLFPTKAHRMPGPFSVTRSKGRRPTPPVTRAEGYVYVKEVGGLMTKENAAALRARRKANYELWRKEQ